jgi:hypothetical protein
MDQRMKHSGPAFSVGKSIQDLAGELLELDANEIKQQVHRCEGGVPNNALRIEQRRSSPRKQVIGVLLQECKRRKSKRRK